MTNRLDRLEAAGLVRRLPDPDDRRGVLVEPTEAGQAAWDRATDTQAGKEALIASALSEKEKEQLHALLRRLMRAFPHEVRVGAKHQQAQTPTSRSRAQALIRLPSGSKSGSALTVQPTHSPKISTSPRWPALDRGGRQVGVGDRALDARSRSRRT